MPETQDTATSPLAGGRYRPGRALHALRNPENGRSACGFHAVPPTGLPFDPGDEPVCGHCRRIAAKEVPPPYYCLTLKQPWATLIIEGGSKKIPGVKDVENRTWRTKHRGPVVIHAGKGVDRDAMTEHGFADPLPKGEILGIVDLVDIVEDSQSPWAEEGLQHFVLVNPRPLERVAMKGELGLYSIPGSRVRWVH